MNPITLDVNKTTIFLLPMLFPNSTYDEIFSNYFKQAYVGLLDDEDDLDYTITLEFDKDNMTPDFIDDFITNLQPNAIFRDGEDNVFTFIFEGTEYDKFQYEHFLAGRYSNFGDDMKTLILDFWKENDKSLLYGILNNDAEIVDKFTPYLDKEILEELKETNGESWPPPNLFVDEFLVM